MTFSGRWATATIGKEAPVDTWLCDLGCHGHVEAGGGGDNSHQARPGPSARTAAARGWRCCRSRQLRTGRRGEQAGVMSTLNEHTLCVSEVPYPSSAGSCTLSPEAQALSWRTKINTTLLLLNFPEDQEQGICVFLVGGIHGRRRAWRRHGRGAGGCREGRGHPRSHPSLKSFAMENDGNAMEKQWLLGTTVEGVSCQYLLKPKMNDVISLLLPALETHFHLYDHVTYFYKKRGTTQRAIRRGRAKLSRRAWRSKMRCV